MEKQRTPLLNRSKHIQQQIQRKQRETNLK